jgi:hypothetical protein
MRADRGTSLQQPPKTGSFAAVPPRAAPRGRGAVFGRRSLHEELSRSPSDTPVITHTESTRVGPKEAERVAVPTPPRPQGWESASPEPVQPQGNIMVSLNVKQRAAEGLNQGAVSTSEAAAGDAGHPKAILLGSATHGVSEAKVFSAQLCLVSLWVHPC